MLTLAWQGASLPIFDRYPYLITRIGRCALRHIALVPADWKPDRLVELLAHQARTKRDGDVAPTA